MKRDFKKIIMISKTILSELENSSSYFFDERPTLSGKPKIDRTEEKKQTSKNIISLCDEIQILTKKKEETYEQADLSI